MNKKVYQWKQESEIVNCKRHLNKLQSLMAQMQDEINQINWPDQLIANVDDHAINTRIEYLRDAFDNISNELHNPS